MISNGSCKLVTMDTTMTTTTMTTRVLTHGANIQTQTFAISSEIIHRPIEEGGI